MTSRPLLALALGTALSACAGGDARGGAAELTDSSGVVIAASRAPAWPEGGGPRITEAPETDVGGGDDPATALFRVAGATRLSDGGIAVANGGSSEIRIFDPAGRRVRTVGRRGAGPGEFQQIRWLQKGRGDSLLVYDAGLARISVLDPSGAFVRSLRLDLADTDAPASPLGQLADGTWLVRARAGARREHPEGEVFRDSSELLRLGADGRRIGAAGRVPDDETVVLNEGSSGGMVFRMETAPPFGRQTLLRVAGDRWYVAEGATAEIRAYAPDGRLLRILRPPLSPPRVSAAHVERYRAGYLGMAGTPEGRREIEARLAKLRFPETMPPYGDLRVDAAGRLWAADFALPDEERIQWTVFDPEGRMLGRVATPRGLLLLEIGRDHVLGLWRDPETGTEHVRLHRLDAA